MEPYIKRIAVLLVFWTAMYFNQFYNEQAVEMELSNIFGFTFITSLFFFSLRWFVGLFSKKNNFKSTDIGIGIMIGFFVLTEIKDTVLSIW